MLVLSRRKGEVIDVGPDITITVVEVRGDKVRLGIHAPEGVRIDRREITEARAREDRNEHAG